LVAGSVAVCVAGAVAAIEVSILNYLEPRSLAFLAVGVGGAVLWLADQAGLMKDPYSEPVSVLHLRDEVDKTAGLDAERSARES
jgi:hypothetical protein